MKKYIFTYGSLILENSPFALKPLESAFIRRYKVVLEKSPATTKNYHYLLLIPTHDDTDIVSGYIAQITEESLKQLDAYEGSTYCRIETICYKRTLEEVRAYVYVKNI